MSFLASRKELKEKYKLEEIFRVIVTMDRFGTGFVKIFETKEEASLFISQNIAKAEGINYMRELVMPNDVRVGFK